MAKTAKSKTASSKKTAKSKTAGAKKSAAKKTTPKKKAPGPKKAGAKRATVKEAASSKKAPAKKTPAKKTAAAEAGATKAAALAAGVAAPAFELPDQDGRAVRLADFAGRKVVVYFYPKDDTPGCTREACAFQAQLDALAERGVAVLGVSRDGAAAHQRFRAKYGLRFPLLSDPDAAAHRAYGAWGTKMMYGKAITGALRTTVLVDEAGRVARVWPSVKVDGHVDQVIAALA